MQRIFGCRKWFSEQVYLVSLIVKHYAINVQQLVISITIVTSPLGYVNLARFCYLFGGYRSSTTTMMTMILLLTHRFLGECTFVSNTEAVCFCCRRSCFKCVCLSFPILYGLSFLSSWYWFVSDTVSLQMSNKANDKNNELIAIRRRSTRLLRK